MATGGGYHGASPPLVVVSGSSRDVFDESVYEGSEAPSTPPAPLWANIPADILGSVLRLVPCAADRASMGSVCRHWRSASRAQVLPAPLPVLVLPRLIRFSCLTSDGALTAARRAQMPAVAVSDDVRIVGSCDDWLIGAKQSGEGFLVNAFSSEVVHLPCLPSNSYYSYNCMDESISSRYQSGARVFRGVLSASPSSVSKYTVANLIYRGGGPDASHPGLAMWQPGMTSWYLCLSTHLNGLSGDLIFYKGKLYMVSMYTPDIFAFEIKEDEHGVSLSIPEYYRVNPCKRPIPRRCNMVVWRGKLLLFIRFFSRDGLHNYYICNVDVFALDLSTRPCGVTQIHNFDGDCIFVQNSGCRSFSPDSHAGVHGDLIYFSDQCIDSPFTYVYNMRDGKVRRCAAGLPQYCTDFPVWIFSFLLNWR